MCLLGKEINNHQPTSIEHIEPDLFIKVRHVLTSTNIKKIVRRHQPSPITHHTVHHHHIKNNIIISNPIHLYHEDFSYYHRFTLWLYQCLVNSNDYESRRCVYLQQAHLFVEFESLIDWRFHKDSLHF